MANDLRAEKFKRAMASSNEFCVSCLNDMGFSKQLHVDDPRRQSGGAVYVEGSGQWCNACAKGASHTASSKKN